MAILPELIRGHPSPHGFDLTATCFGTVALDAMITGEKIAPGDALIGLPSSGLHSNSYSLARRAVEGLPLDAPFGDGTLADALLEPTVIYVRAALELLRSGIPVHGLAHITGGGLLNLLRLNEAVGFTIEDPLPDPADHRPRARARRGERRRGVGGLQHGLRLRRRRAATPAPAPRPHCSPRTTRAPAGSGPSRTSRPSGRAGERHCRHPRRSADGVATRRARTPRRLPALAVLAFRHWWRAGHAVVGLLALPVRAHVGDLAPEALGPLRHVVGPSFEAVGLLLVLGHRVRVLPVLSRVNLFLGAGALVELLAQVRVLVSAPLVGAFFAGQLGCPRLLARGTLALDLLEPELLGLGIRHW